MLIVIALLIVIAGCRHPVRMSTPAPLSVAPASVSPAAVMSPFLCVVQPALLHCQATYDVRFRRGQAETRIPQGAVWQWRDPKGTGDAQVWFGCTGSDSCEGVPIFSSQTVSATPAEGLRVVQGKPNVIPFGSLGIVSVTVQNNAFTTITDRWTGSYAPPILAAGPGTAVSCAADTCTVSVK